MTNALRIALGDASYPRDISSLRRVVAVAANNHILGQMPMPKEGDVSPDDYRVLSVVIDNARARAKRDKNRNAFEADRLQRALLNTSIQPVILKGAAYQGLGMKAGQGRRSSDLDILVDKDDLAGVEQAMREAGFIDHASTLNPYDQAYYRLYMHELPPLLHKNRRSIIDVHHALSPRTAKAREDTAALLHAAIPFGDQKLKVLAPIDLFLHAALHSLYDGDLTHPVRHMLDLVHLYDELSIGDKERLLGRAEEVGLSKPARLALRLISSFREVKASLPSSPAPVTERIMRHVIAKGDPGPITGFYLYCRGHLLRMPLPKLLKHLLTKARRRLRLDSAGPEVDRQTLEEHLR